MNNQLEKTKMENLPNKTEGHESDYKMSTDVTFPEVRKWYPPVPADTTDENDSGFIKALTIAFPEAKISNKNSSIKFHVTSINDTDFSNLFAAIKYYAKQISIKRSAGQLVIEITAKEVENEL